MLGGEFHNNLRNILWDLESLAILLSPALELGLGSWGTTVVYSQYLYSLIHSAEIFLEPAMF